MTSESQIKTQKNSVKEALIEFSSPDKIWWEVH